MTMVNAPLILPRLLTAYPGGAREIQAFPYGTGTTYPELMETIRTWIPETLIPYLQGLNQDNSDLIDILNDGLTHQTSSVMAQLAVVLQQIVAGENVNLNDASILAALQSAGSVTNGWVGGGLRLFGPGIDPTGATDSTAAINTFLAGVKDGATVTVPEGAVLKITSRLRLTKRVRFTGGGELRWAGAEDVAIAVEADFCHLDGLYLTNPAGAPVSGIYVYANGTRLTGNRVVGFRDGICVSAEGEYHDTIIANNEVLDVIGSGTGPTNGDWASGEANGDGIVSWGAATVIVGNRVTAKTGRDARIGIHVENLADRETVPYENADALATIVGNVVTGPFRRSITSEGVQHAVITGNSIAGSRFWGINLVGLAHHSIVANNTIKWTSTDTTAGYFRCGVLIYCIQEAMTDVSILGNTVHAVPGAHIDYGIVVNNDPSVNTLGLRRVKIHGNSVEDESNTLGDGVHISVASDAVEVTENRVYRFGAMGVYANQGTRFTVTGNRLYGRGTAAGVRGISLEGAANEAIVDGNFVRDVETGVRAYFRGEAFAFRNNTIRNGTTGLDLYGSQGGIIAVLGGNLVSNVAAPLANAPAGVTFA